MNEKRIQIMAISGSLRSRSSNTSILRACAAAAPGNMEVAMYDGIGGSPHFNPEIDGDEPPPSVAEFRTRLREADGVLICTPEYAGGVPGVLKNALDWCVSSGVFMNKPVAVISASPSLMGGKHAHESLLLTLGMIDANLPEGAALTIPLVSKYIGPEGRSPIQ
ncbi:NAD(P)H-dependent oxidoreductase [Paenibacillus sp. P25]|nr:NAD(P)H-dependent oxidoreductase [Paenibacillus sp. P25]